MMIPDLRDSLRSQRFSIGLRSCKRGGQSVVFIPLSCARRNQGPTAPVKGPTMGLRIIVPIFNGSHGALIYPVQVWASVTPPPVKCKTAGKQSRKGCNTCHTLPVLGVILCGPSKTADTDYQPPCYLTDSINIPIVQLT